ncbi:MAG: OmpA family protein [Archangium sp.]|nr:OmpA family protein [Archangium sp.]
MTAMIRSVSLGLAMTLMGCAHQQPVPVAAVEPAPPITAPPQVAVTPAPTAAPDGVTALEQALQNATAYFDFNGDQLSPQGMTALQRVGEVLRKHPSLQIRVEGNCDERGTSEYNLALGQRRAEMAKKYLVALGVTPAQVDTLSYGAEKPADPGHTDEAWARNRRADVLRASN